MTMTMTTTMFATKVERVGRSVLALETYGNVQKRNAQKIKVTVQKKKLSFDRDKKKFIHCSWEMSPLLVHRRCWLTRLVLDFDLACQG